MSIELHPRTFERELEATRQWLSKAEGAVGAETASAASAPVNIATLDEHLRKYKGLKEEEEANRATVRRLVEQAEGIVPTLSDPDRLTLQNLLDDTCDRMNQGRYSIAMIFGLNHPIFGLRALNQPFTNRVEQLSSC